jgi:hypothetical protein
MDDRDTALRERKITRTVSIAPSLAAWVEAQARKDGHGTFSSVIVAALTEYRERHDGDAEAA